MSVRGASSIEYIYTIGLALSNSYHMDGSFTFGNKQNEILLRIIHWN